MENLLLVSLGLLILTLISEKWLIKQSGALILAYSSSSITHWAGDSGSRYNTRTAQDKRFNQNDKEEPPAKPELDEEDLLLDEKELLLEQKEILQSRLKEIETEIASARRLFRRVIKTMAIAPCPEESTDVLTKADRLLNGLTNWDRGQNRRQLPDNNPSTGQEITQMLEIRRHSEESSYELYTAENIIEALGGETEVWNNQSLTLQQIERICLDLGDELREIEDDLKERKDFHFFFRGQNSAQEPRLLILSTEVTPRKVAFVLKYPSDRIKANDLLFLKKMPDPKRFKEQDLR